MQNKITNAIDAKNKALTLLAEAHELSNCLDYNKIKEIFKITSKIKVTLRAYEIPFKEIGFESENHLKESLRQRIIPIMLEEFRTKKSSGVPMSRGFVRRITKQSFLLGKTLLEIGTSKNELEITDDELSLWIKRFESTLSKSINRHPNYIKNLEGQIVFWKSLL